MVETPGISMPSVGAFKYGCAILFPLVTQLSTLAAAEYLFYITVRVEPQKHVLLSNRHHQDHVNLNLRLKTLPVMIWQWLMRKLKVSVNSDGVCLLYCRFQLRPERGHGKEQVHPLW